MTKARFKIRRTDKTPLPPRYPSAAQRLVLENRFSTGPTSDPTIPDLEGLFSTDMELRLEDEIPSRELNRFAARILECHAAMKQSSTSPKKIAKLLRNSTKELSSLTHLKAEHKKTQLKKTKQIRLTQKLIKSTEPILNNKLIAESKKSSLLKGITLAVEKMMQLKMRKANLAERIHFLEKALSIYLFELGRKMNCHKEICIEFFQLTDTAIKSHK